MGHKALGFAERPASPNSAYRPIDEALHFAARERLLLARDVVCLQRRVAWTHGEIGRPPGARWMLRTADPLPVAPRMARGNPGYAASPCSARSRSSRDD